MMPTDFHSHILPRIDDGSASLRTSLEMLRMEKAQGISRVVATPHFYPQKDEPYRFLARRKAAMERLREAMGGRDCFPEVELGAEVYYFSGISNSDLLSALTIGEKRCILIEMPPSPWSDAMYRELEGIYVKQNLIPVIAHLDRYIGPWRTFGIPERLRELPVMVQANASFFLQRSTSRMALKLLKNGTIRVLGSDCHNLTDRAPNLGLAVEIIRKRLGDDMIQRMCWQEEEIFL